MRGSGLGSLLSNLLSALGSGSGFDSASGAGVGDLAGTVPDSAFAVSIPESASVIPVGTTLAATNAPVGADLVLEDVKLVAPATLVAGPAYRVKFRNQGTAVAANFEVAILAE